MAFCGRCGTRLASPCPSCGFANPEGFAFCGKCGARVAEPPAPTLQGSPAFASPRSYTPKHLAEKILTSKAALEGERKQVTVLFADLKGSMELLADRDPEEARKLLDPVLERMMEAVHRYEGTVNQVMGDGIMALFGAPLAHEDHAVRACYAALRMQESVRQYAEGVRRDEGVSIQIRVGVNSGDVVVRSIGSDLRMDYTAVGQTTHLAARMEQLAAPGSIVMAPETLRLAEGYVAVKPLGPVKVKGLSEPVEVYEVIERGRRADAARTRGGARVHAVRGAGRRAGAAPGRARAGGRGARSGGRRGRRAGRREVPSLLRVRPFAPIRSIEGDTPLGLRRLARGGDPAPSPTARRPRICPVIDLLKAYFQIDARDDGQTIREKVTGKLLTLDETLRPLLPALLALLDVPVEERDWHALDPPQRRRHTHEAIRRLLLRESQRQPLCLVFEDLHWIDAETQAVLDGLVESLPAARLLLLVNYRPEYRHAWGSKTYYSQARIDPLPEASATELLDALLGADPSTRPLTAAPDRAHRGQPVLPRGERARRSSRRACSPAIPDATGSPDPSGVSQVPATVQAVLAARIDRLPPEAKSLLQSAAVVGKDVPFAHLRAIAERPEEALRAELAHLQAAEFLYETSLFPDLEYTFKHALTHEVAYGSVLHERRRALHARIVEAIETLHPDRLGEHVERLAQHALRGEVWPKAVAYLRQAAAKAVARSANREAVSCLEQALGALRHLPESPETREQAIDLRLDLQVPLNNLGEIERLLDYLREAEPLAGALGDLPRMGRVAAYMAFGLIVTGHPAQAAASGEQALAIARTVGDLGLEAQANYRLGQAYRCAGRVPPRDRGVQAKRRRARWRPPDRALRDARPAGGHVPSVHGLVPRRPRRVPRGDGRGGRGRADGRGGR